MRVPRAHLDTVLTKPVAPPGPPANPRKRYKINIFSVLKYQSMVRVVLEYSWILSVLGPARRGHAVHGGGEEAAKDEAECRLDDRERRIGFGRRAAGRVAVGHTVAGHPEDEADGGKPCRLGKKPAHVLRARCQAWRCRISRGGTLGGGQWEKAATKRRAGAALCPAPTARSQAFRQAHRHAFWQARRHAGTQARKRPGGRAAGRRRAAGQAGGRTGCPQISVWQSP